MLERIRFHLDENVDPDIGRALQSYGIDITTAKEAGLRAHSDKDHLEYACLEKRVIVTHDVDFLRIAVQTNDHPGIVYCDRSTRSMGDIIRNLILIYEVLRPEEMTGKVEFL